MTLEVPIETFFLFLSFVTTTYTIMFVIIERRLVKVETNLEWIKMKLSKECDEDGPG